VRGYERQRWPGGACAPRSGLRPVGERKHRLRALIERETVPLIQGAAMNLLTVDRLRELYALEANLGVRAATR
jgi:hypothetical protein